MQLEEINCYCYLLYKKHDIFFCTELIEIILIKNKLSYQNQKSNKTELQINRYYKRNQKFINTESAQRAYYQTKIDNQPDSVWKL